MPETATAPAPVSEVLSTAVAALGGQQRDGQVQMATEVAEAMEEGRHLLVQAGTGTGKSLGYLVPAMLHDKRVVVATATLALQHQLVERDLPRLVEAVKDVPGLDTSYAVLKGRSNYACLHRIRAGVPDDQGTLVDVPLGAMAEKVLELRAWAEEETEQGGSGERDNAPRHTDREWRQVSVNHRECLGASKCPFGAECFAELAREKAHRSHLIVTNHSLLAIDAIEDVPMIPDYDTVVIDEAHELTARVTQAATDELGVSDIERAARRAMRWTDGDGDPAGDLEDAAAAARRGDRGDAARPHRPGVRPSSPTPSCSYATRRARACRRSRASPAARARPTPAAPRPRAWCRRSSSTPSGWPPAPRPTCCGWARRATASRPGSTSRRCRCGARCATSCSPTRPSSSPARP